MRRPKCKSAATHRTVGTPIVIEIMLPVVLLAIDAVALDMLGFPDAGALTTSYHAIGLGPVFHVINMLLAALKAIRFALG